MPEAWGREHEPVFEQYTERAKRTLAFAKYEASQMGSDTMQAEHILLGLLRESESIILQWFQEWKVDPGWVRDEIGMMSTFQKRNGPPVELAISREAQRVLAYAVEESKRLEHHYVGTEHVLLGLLREENSMAARILSQKGMRIPSLREAVVAFHRRKAATQERERAMTGLRTLAARLVSDPNPAIMSAAEARATADAFDRLAKDVDPAMALLVHRGGVVVASLEKLPETLGSWIEALADDENVVEVTDGTVEVLGPNARPVVVSWIGLRAFLLVVAGESAPEGRTLKVTREVAEKLTSVFART